jgi:dUTP diphosphatase
MSLKVLFKMLSEQAIVPTKAYEASAGFDVYSPRDTVIKPGEQELIYIDISVAIPLQHYGRLLSRSSMAMNYIDVKAGVIDADYRGNLGVLLHNYDNKTFYIKSGMKIAQLVIMQLPDITLEEVQELETTARAHGGFGSSGKYIYLIDCIFINIKIQIFIKLLMLKYLYFTKFMFLS